MPMPPMLAYSIKSSRADGAPPYIVIDVGPKQTKITPANPKAGGYWFAFLDVMNPRTKVKEYMVHGDQHSTVPAGLDADMSNPNFIFVVATYTLPIPWVPQGPFYDFFAKYGASRELRMLEQFNATMPCGGFNNCSYILTSQGGPRVPPNPPPASYEAARTDQIAAALMMSLMESGKGGGPYAIMDSYTWTSP